MRALLTLAAASAALAGMAVAQTPPADTMIPGYLKGAALNAVSFAPPPPTADAADRGTYEATRGLAGSPRWALALADVPLDREAPRRVFACALGRPMPESTLAVLERMKADSGAATSPAKEKYARRRPYVGEAQPRTCSPMGPAAAARSYPSGHASIGWGWALVLAELVPERADAILARGRAFGESRVVCGVHYPSDVAAGRDIASAVVARLHAEPAFRADLERARADLAQTPAAGEAPTCAIEAQALVTPLAGG